MSIRTVPTLPRGCEGNRSLTPVRAPSRASVPHSPPWRRVDHLPSNSPKSHVFFSFFYIEILSNNFGKYLGFTTGTYGKDSTADYNVLSNIIPNATTVNTLLVKCSLVNNGCSNQSDILDAFAIGGSSGGTFGGNLNYTNTIEKFVKISEGRYNNFIVTIVDQNNNEISILDNNLLINFLIRVK